MTKPQFKTLLATRNGASFITITALTEPDWLAARETGENPYKNHVVKRSVVNGVINWKYENSVNNQRAREGLSPDFESLPRKWGERIHGTPWVEHKGKTYLELKVENVLSTTYVDENGVELNSELVKHYIKPSHSGGERQGVEREVILRDYNLNNIVAFTWCGVTGSIL
jgi:hypothetical protein